MPGSKSGRKSSLKTSPSSAPDAPVWLLLDSRGFGGVESHVLALAKALHARQVPVEVVLLADHGPHPLDVSLAGVGVPLRRLNGGWRGLIHGLRQHTPALLHAHGYKSAVLARLAGWRCKPPVVTTHHAGESGSGKIRLYLWLDRMSAHLVGGNIAVSKNVADHLPRNTTILPNFVSLPPPPKPESAGPLLGFVGRLVADKGADLLPALVKQLPADTRLHIFGDGPLRAKLDGVSDQLVLHGAVDMDVFWPRLDLLIIPSRAEGLPMAALEAMAHGVPVIASEVGDLPVLLADLPEPEARQTPFWLCPPGDLAGMATRISYWKNMPSQKKQVFRLAVRDQIAQSYTPEAVLPHVLKIYRQTTTRCGQIPPKSWII